VVYFSVYKNTFFSKKFGLEKLITNPIL